MGRDGAVGLLPKPLLFALLLGKGLHHGNARQRLMNVRLEPAFNLALEPRGRAERFAQEERRDDHERRDGQRQDRERHVKLQHQEHHQADREQRVARGENERVEHLVHAPTVGVDATHGVANGSARVEQEGTALEPREEVFGHVEHHAAAPGRPAAGDHEFDHAVQSEQHQPGKDDDKKECRGSRIQVQWTESLLKCHRHVRLTLHLVQEQLDRPRLEGCQRGGEERQQPDDAERPPMRRGVGQKASELAHALGRVVCRSRDREVAGRMFKRQRVQFPKSNVRGLQPRPHGRSYARGLLLGASRSWGTATVLQSVAEARAGGHGKNARWREGWHP